MEEIITKTYRTTDGKIFSSKDEAQAHEEKLNKSITSIQKLPHSTKIAYANYCYYVILVAKAELMLRHYVSPLNITEVKVSDTDLRSMSSGYELSQVGKQIDTLLNIVGIHLSFYSDVEGYHTALKVKMEDKFKLLTPEDSISIIKETLFND